MPKPLIPLLLLTTLLAGCSKENPDGGSSAAPVPKNKTFQLSVNEGNVAVDGVAVTLDDKPLGTLDRKQTAIPIELPENTLAFDLAPRVKARIQTSCGDEDFPLTPPYPTAAAEKDAREKYSSTKDSLIFKIERLPYSAIFIDNVGGKARKLAVGETTIDLAADKPVTQPVRIGRCATARKIKIDGDDAGEATQEAKKVTLVDAAGGHCYRAQIHRYKTAGTPGSGLGAIAPVTYKGARVYAVDVPTDFLTASPTEFVRAPDPMGLDLPIDFRTELNRCEGTPKTGGALR